MNKELITLVDGSIIDIETNSTHYSGCPTCDYGAYDELDVTIYLTSKTIEFYSDNISISDIIKIFLNHIDEIKEMKEFEFCDWFNCQIHEICSHVKITFKER